MKKLSILLLLSAMFIGCEQQEEICDCELVTYSGSREVYREFVGCGTPYLPDYQNESMNIRVKLECK